MRKDTKVEDLKDYIDSEDLSSRAVTIDAIAVDESESEFLTEEIVEESNSENIDLSKYKEYEAQLEPLIEEGCIDAFDNVEYLADLDSVDEFDLEDSTEELFPGVRVLKRKVLTEDDADEILENAINSKKSLSEELFPGVTVIKKEK